MDLTIQVSIKPRHMLGCQHRYQFRRENGLQNLLLSFVLGQGLKRCFKLSLELMELHDVPHKHQAFKKLHVSLLKLLCARTSIQPDHLLQKYVSESLHNYLNHTMYATANLHRLGLKRPPSHLKRHVHIVAAAKVFADLERLSFGRCS